jgi:hypothetical protein
MAETEFEQPLEPVRAGRRRGRAGLAAWIVVLGGTAVVAVGGRLGADAAAPPQAAVATTEPSTTAPAARVLPEVLVLTGRTDVEVRTVALTVRGRAADAVEQVELVLVREEDQVATQTVRRSSRGTFSGVFTLGAPRTAGPVTVVAIGRDRHGIPVATARQEVRVGALEAVGALGTRGGALARPTPSRRPIGEDGLMGRIVLERMAAEQARGAGRIDGLPTPVESGVWQPRPLVL